MLSHRVNTVSFSLLLSLSFLMADEKIDSPSNNPVIPSVPNFSITYLGDRLLCTPTGLIKTKMHKDLVTYECQKETADVVSKDAEDEMRGHAETERLRNEVKDKIAKGVIYSVEIPLSDASRPTLARIIAERQLNNRPYGEYLTMLLPAKLYMSIRPQLVNSDDDGGLKLQDGGSRAGFYYYYQFDNDVELMFQYEAGLDWDSNTPFINASDASNSNRRLSYFAVTYMDSSMILGKYWSAYYDIAGFTDQFMTFGAQASGAFSAGPSGTGRAEKMIQFRKEHDIYDATAQVQIRHDALRGWDTDYAYTVAGSFIYKGLDEMRVGASINYGKFDDITPQMQDVEIDGDDLSTILGITYKSGKFGVNSVLSYMQNHTLDDQGVYFDSVGAELYMRYDIDESFRVAGGGNWLLPEDSDYEGKYNIKNIILSLQYTFGEKTFDDMVYMELSLPNGRLANGESKDARIAIGLRYLLDY